jgi:predicted transcriptional regulator
MVNLRADAEFVKKFDEVAKKHNRDRTKELKQLMLDDIRSEEPDYQPPLNY